MATNRVCAASWGEAKVSGPGCCANAGASEHPSESATRAAANRANFGLFLWARLEIDCDIMFFLHYLFLIDLFLVAHRCPELSGVHHPHGSRLHGIRHHQSSTVHARKSLVRCRR